MKPYTHIYFKRNTIFINITKYIQYKTADVLNYGQKKEAALWGE